MFALIITIISIAMVVALSAATLYYMSSVTIDQTTKVDASVFVSSGQQIAAAFVMANLSDNATTPPLTSLVPDYLTMVPNYKGSDLSFHATYTNYLTTYVSKDVCIELNTRNGITVDDPDVTMYTYSCLVDADVTGSLAFYKVKNE